MDILGMLSGYQLEMPRSSEGTATIENEKLSDNPTCAVEPPKDKEMTIANKIAIGIMKKNTGRVRGSILLRLTSRSTKSFFRAEFLDRRIITSEVIKGAISPSSISSKHALLSSR